MAIFLAEPENTLAGRLIDTTMILNILCNPKLYYHANMSISDIGLSTTAGAGSVLTQSVDESTQTTAMRLVGDDLEQKIEELLQQLLSSSYLMQSLSPVSKSILAARLQCLLNVVVV
jgi:hypothetical protein